MTSRSTSIACRSANEESAAIFCNASRSVVVAPGLNPPAGRFIDGEPRLQQAVHDQVRVAANG